MPSSKPDVLEGQEPHKGLVWWTPNIDHKITPEVRQVFQDYSNIPPQEVVPHVYAIREKAWAIRPYPCTGMGAFLTPTISLLPLYKDILSRVKSGSLLLDIGCYCGTDLRRLVIDGAPQTNIFGTDIVNHWELGFDLFRDKDKFSVKFIEANVLDPNDELQMLCGKIDIISATHLLHNWDWATQVQACVIITSFSKVGTIVVGTQVGTKDMQARIRKIEEAGMSFSLHDGDSFGRLWREVGSITDTEWKTEVKFREWEELGYTFGEVAYIGDDTALMQFEVTRIR